MMSYKVCCCFKSFFWNIIIWFFVRYKRVQNLKRTIEISFGNKSLSNVCFQRIKFIDSECCPDFYLKFLKIESLFKQKALPKSGIFIFLETNEEIPLKERLILQRRDRSNQKMRNLWEFWCILKFHYQQKSQYTTLNFQ